MKRWHEDFNISFREWRQHHRFHVEMNTGNVSKRIGIGISPYKVDCICDTQIGRFRKKDAWDCGKPRCYMCHGQKLLKHKKHCEKKSDLNFKEQLNDLTLN